MKILIACEFSGIVRAGCEGNMRVVAKLRATMDRIASGKRRVHP